MHTSDCPCQSRRSYAECCGIYHLAPLSAPDAERLMRSRYSAYATAQTDYIVRTTVPVQQALLDTAAIDDWARQSEWLGLDVLCHLPDITPRHALVEFEARFREGGETHVHRELSAFVRIDGAWYFIDPTVPLPAQKSPCFCGSGKKFKHCCGKLFMPL